MWKNFWMFIVILIVAIVLALVVWSFARADYIINSFATWEEVKVIEGEDKIIFILKNPLYSETVYAIVEVKEYGVPSYVLIGKDIRVFVCNEPAYMEIKRTKEAKDRIWIFLRMQCGIQPI